MTGTSSSLTEYDAHRLLDFTQKRVFGWTIVIGMNNSDRTDGRTKAAKLSDRLMRECFLLGPRPGAALDHLMAGQEPELLWPESHREFIRFCLWHRVPRDLNEPLNEDLPEDCDPRREWPEFIHQYDKPATLADMPAPPPVSEEFKARFGA
ncbi:hypothetical protein [Agrobacterium tumefaciens]|uniref:Uncharacterized protein n=1 Tax=Agrobacterium tumefaciens TaxID=358 RepID=A0AA44JBJ6_AGRTU|nr:hypothetical protein [Agrobacterium tumefaciens]NSL21754.1 hypothetical protein [Agrobacterium tumefaciens]NTB85525.1 hypothetical protein [Agrobacterium tumefaciens]NTC18854.1 hypothetical protein [Agrobacterium tumefaciens]NTC30852.1 hypothetical protein [Agrobacterium tumefaciens]NTC55716.1 hypothetical protein [Agrobacterium tumefaciens]